MRTNLKKKQKVIDSRPCFAALDFETADYSRDSACALSIVVAEDAAIKAQRTFLIRPPRRDFVFTYLHGISWSDVSGKPDFKGHWPQIAEMLEGVDFLAAHNARFDRSVMEECCTRARIKKLKHPFLCTVKLARNVWRIYPTKLPDVCKKLKIPLKHHDASCDALACAKIVIAALKESVSLSDFIS